MKIKEKLNLDREGLLAHGPINIVILGDSVSHASFLDYNNYEAVYWSVLKNKLHAKRPFLQNCYQYQVLKLLRKIFQTPRHKQKL